MTALVGLMQCSLSCGVVYNKRLLLQLQDV